MVYGAAVVLGALAVLEAFPRAAPSFLPRGLQVLWSQRLFDSEIYRHDPDLGHCLKAPHARDLRYGDFSIGVRHRRLAGSSPCGYRAEAFSSGDPSPAASAQRPDMVVLGDSHVYGLEVDQPSVWTSIVAKETGLRVANLGVRMYGSTQDVDLYLRHGRGLRPRIVALMLCPNDPWDNEVFHDWLSGNGVPAPMDSDEMMYRVCRTLGVPSSPTICSAAVAFGRSGLSPHLLLGRVVARSYAKRALDPDPGRAGMRMVLKDVGRLNQGLAGTPLVVILNEGWPRGQREVLASGLEKARIPWMEIPGMAGSSRVPLDGHWTEIGHRQVAAQVADFLRKNGHAPNR